MTTIPAIVSGKTVAKKEKTYQVKKNLQKHCMEIYHFITYPFSYFIHFMELVACPGNIFLNIFYEVYFDLKKNPKYVKENNCYKYHHNITMITSWHLKLLFVNNLFFLTTDKAALQCINAQKQNCVCKECPLDPSWDHSQPWLLTKLCLSAGLCVALTETWHRTYGVIQMLWPDAMQLNDCVTAQAC